MKGSCRREGDLSTTPFDRRRTALLLALAPVLLPLSCYRAMAAYPDRVIKIIVPFAPGGGTDAIARVLANPVPLVAVPR